MFLSNENGHHFYLLPFLWISSKWRKVRSLVTSPFIQTYKRKKYPWIQLAGHQGNFVAGQIQGTIMKNCVEMKLIVSKN
nr:inositol-trisphosphate 3-kinase A-like isoform X3 [Dermatophagoides farinae]